MEDEVVGNEGVDAGNTSANDSLQTEMTGDFFDFDDGLGAVVDQSGNPFTKDDGKYYSSIEEYQNALNQNGKPAQQQQQPKPQQAPAPVQPNANAKTPIQPRQQPVQPSGFDSFYKKDTGFDVASILSDAPKFNEFAYQRENNPIVQQNANNLQQQQQPPIDQKTADANTIKEYKDGLVNSALKPIERAYQASLAGYQREGAEMPKYVYEAFNAEYSQLSTAIDELVSTKKEELLEARFKEKEEGSNFSKIEAKSLENFDRISTQFFPKQSIDQSKDKLSKLIFGYKDNGGKFVRGFGADIVDHAFDLANNGKTYTSEKEWSDAYNKWWAKYASNPKNLLYVAQRAWDRFVASNLDGIRDGYRSTWDQEQREKLKQVQSNPHATRGGNAGQDDAAQAQLDAYFTPPGRHM